MEVRVGDIYASVEPIMAVGKQEMDIASAERVSNFIEAYVKVLQKLDERRIVLVNTLFDGEGQKQAAFNTFAEEKEELPEMNFKEFSFLRITPDGLNALKRAGLYA